MCHFMSIDEAVDGKQKAYFHPNESAALVFAKSSILHPAHQNLTKIVLYKRRGLDWVQYREVRQP